MTSSTPPTPEAPPPPEAKPSSEAAPPNPSRSNELKARARDASQRTRQTWSRLRSRVGAQATQGAALARLKREQLGLSRALTRHRTEVGELAAKAFASQGSPIAVEGVLASALAALSRSQEELARVEKELAEVTERLRKG